VEVTGGREPDNALFGGIRPAPVCLVCLDACLLPAGGFDDPPHGYLLGVTTTADCFKAIERTLKKAAAALDGHRVPFMLGGSLAVWVRGGPESCNDLDLMVRPGDAEAALAALEGAGMRGERPPEDWLYKAWDDDVLVDLIFGPKGLAIDDETFERADPVSAFGLEVRAMALEDVLITKLRALHEHYLDYDSLLQMARAVRERIDWDQVRRETGGSPYARAFFTLVEELGVVEPAPAARGEGRSRIRLAE
jgi:putative nucleotidyltransferase-like protein